MIFPDWGSSPAQNDKQSLPLFTEWATDWERGCFALQNGHPYTVSGNAALRIWIRCALHPESRRFLFSAHSADYGNRLAELLAEGGDPGILENRLCKEIRETLMISPYITSVDGFSCMRNANRMTVHFVVHTVYEDFGEEVSIPYGT